MVANRFLYLHPAQSVKHILGLKNEFGKEGFRLLYLWYDVLGEEGSVHRKEIKTFSEVVKSNGVKFHALSYQELIVKLSNEYKTEHGEYISYIRDRYLQLPEDELELIQLGSLIIARSRIVHDNQYYPP